MPYLSRQDIERIACRVTSAYRRLPILGGSPCGRIVPQILIDDLLGLKTEYHTLSKEGDILGLTCCDSTAVRVYDDTGPEYRLLDGKTILIESALTAENANVGRLNFTLVHEACHQIFKMLYPKEYLSVVRRRQIYYCTTEPRRSPDDWEEWRANALTSAILMPMDIVLSNMALFGLGYRVKTLNRVFESEVYDGFCSMADYMGVSRKALSIRLKQLNLLDRDYLERPYDLVDVYTDDAFDAID